MNDNKSLIAPFFIFLLWVLILFQGCKLSNNDDRFQDHYYQYYLKWMTTFHIVEKDFHFKKKFMKEKRFLLSYYYKSFDVKNDCLVIRSKIPLKNKKQVIEQTKKLNGDLIILNYISPEECLNSKFLIESAKKEIFPLDKIAHSYYVTQKRKRVPEVGYIRPYTLYLITEEKKKFVFPFINVRGPSQKKIYSASIPQGIGDGLILLPIKGRGQEKVKVKPFTERGLGHFNKLIIKNPPILCHDVNNNCEDKIPNVCHRCAYGWFEVSGGLCLKKGRKYCGPNVCGQKGGPPCWKGVDWINRPKKIICGEYIDGLFCEKGLSPICIKKNHMICY